MPVSAPQDGAAVGLARLGGLAALLGGLAWTLKGIVIPLGGDQPPLLFEAAPVLFGVGLLSVGYRPRADVAPRRSPSRPWPLLIGLLGLASWARPVAGPLGWWIGLSVVPSLFVGGALSEIDEWLFEMQLTCLGLAWMVVGWTTFSYRTVDSHAS